MRTIALTNDKTVEIVSGYAAPIQSINTVPQGPAWYVVGAFYVPATERGAVEIIGSVTEPGVELHVRVFDLTLCAPVEGSVATLSAMVDTRALSGVFDLRGGHLYQFQAEVIGPSGFASLKAVQLQS